MPGGGQHAHLHVQGKTTAAQRRHPLLEASLGFRDVPDPSWHRVLRGTSPSPRILTSSLRTALVRVCAGYVCKGVRTSCRRRPLSAMAIAAAAAALSSWPRRTPACSAPIRPIQSCSNHGNQVPADAHR